MPTAPVVHHHDDEPGLDLASLATPTGRVTATPLIHPDDDCELYVIDRTAS
jgi:hypothetical protein